MQTFPIIRHLRRLAGARGEMLLYPLDLDGEIVMCRDEAQKELIIALYRAWVGGKRNRLHG